MRGAALALLALLLSACATGDVTFEFTPVEGRKVGGVYEAPETVRLSKMTVAPRWYSRGCVALEVEGEHVRFAIQQDGTSDWVIGRSAPTVVQGIVTSALAFANAPAKVLMHLVGVPSEETAPPSEVHGCGGLFASDD